MRISRRRGALRPGRPARDGQSGAFADRSEAGRPTTGRRPPRAGRQRRAIIAAIRSWAALAADRLVTRFIRIENA